MSAGNLAVPRPRNRVWAALLPVLLAAPLLATGACGSRVLADPCTGQGACNAGAGAGAGAGAAAAGAGNNNQAGSGNTTAGAGDPGGNGNSAGSGGSGNLCGGIQGKACGPSEYCAFTITAACGGGDQSGICVSIPKACDLNVASVCGCDAKSYINDCYAAMASTSVAHMGECNPTTGTTCGGLKGLTCEKGAYCEFPIATQCGSGDQTGTCQKVPDGCLADYLPVCGCDGQTYGNACAAALKSTSIASTGPCPTAMGISCGGRLGMSCAKSQYCNYSLAAQCGFADGTGTCTAIPGVCTKIYAPVCGCDGKNYPNACSAAGAGISVAANGICK